MMFFNRIFFTAFILFLFSAFNGKAQFYNFPANYSFGLLTERVLAKKSYTIHSGLKPYVPFFSQDYAHVPDSHNLFPFITDDPAIDLIFNKHFLRVEPKNEKFKLRIDPLLNLETGRDLGDSILTGRLYTNSRGVIASGSVGDKFYFETMFSENQSVFPAYIAQSVRATGVVPGQGRWKTFKANGFDYAFSSGFVSIQPVKNINVQLGHGKQKVGNGYRSLLLSDNAFNYPYTRITQQWFKGKVQYTNIYAAFMNLTSASAVVNPNSERLFQKKAAAFQYLSYNPSSWMNIGFFQGLIWKAGDDKNRQHLEWQYFNPVIYSAAAQYGLNHENNVLVGLDLKIKLTDKLNLYGQAMLDQYKASNLKEYGGLQAGVCYYDVFGVKNLFLQAELNYAGGSAYIDSTETRHWGYTHYNQPIAFTPLHGTELLLVADYKIKRFFTNLKFHQQSRFMNPLAGNMDVQLINAQVGYLINPSYNLNIMLGLMHRTGKIDNFNAPKWVTNYMYVGFRTSLYNLYYDF